MLYVALLDLPYFYYQVLRLVVFGVSVYIIYKTIGTKVVWLLLSFCVIAVLFNPIMPIHLNRQAWRVIDVISSVFFLLMAI